MLLQMKLLFQVMHNIYNGENISLSMVFSIVNIAFILVEAGRCTMI